MMGLETIRKLNAQAARSRAAKAKPVTVNQGNIDSLAAGKPDFKIPMIGDYRPRGYVLKRELFIDISGLGAPNEPALTQRQLAGEMKVGMAYALIEAGQFQGYVAEFTPPKSKER
jgi:hypothetical protein